MSMVFSARAPLMASVNIRSATGLSTEELEQWKLQCSVLEWDKEALLTKYRREGKYLGSSRLLVPGQADSSARPTALFHVLPPETRECEAIYKHEPCAYLAHLVLRHALKVFGQLAGGDGPIVALRAHCLAEEDVLANGGVQHEGYLPHIGDCPVDGHRALFLIQLKFG